MTPGKDDFDRVAQQVRAARHLVVFTGAGVSAESGIPTFRDTSGLWERFPPEEFACWSGLVKTALLHPSRFVEFLIAVLEPIAAATPNPAHRAIAELQHRCRTTVITQNVDGLHQEAGSKTVREVHGTFLQVADGKGRLARNLTRADLRHVVEQLYRVHDGSLPLLRLPGALKGLVNLMPPIERPRVVLFGEGMAEPDWSFAQADTGNCDHMLVVGTSRLVYPASALPRWAKQAGAEIVVVDPEEPVTADQWLEGRAGDVLPRLLEHLR
jgi:NAD-dependent deacetylase